jgi:hypothetical protein
VSVVAGVSVFFLQPVCSMIMADISMNPEMILNVFMGVVLVNDTLIERYPHPENGRLSGKHPWHEVDLISSQTLLMD